jgi:serine/threonine protein kinase
MDDAFERDLKAAKNPEEKATLIAEAVLTLLSNEVALVARQCVLFHWFDQSIVESLLQAIPSDTESVQDVYRQITSLPFIEQLSWGVAYQELTRQGLLKHYARTQPELLKNAARVAAPLYRASTDNDRNAAEALFCSIVSGDASASVLQLNILLEQAMSRQDWSRMENLFHLQEEAEQLSCVEPIPGTEQYWMLRSIIDRMQDKLDAALSDYDHALTINPKNALACLNRSIVHRQQMHDEQAQADYNEALRLDPALVQTYIDSDSIKNDDSSEEKNYVEAYQLSHTNLHSEEQSLGGPGRESASVADHGKIPSLEASWHRQGRLGQTVGDYRLLRWLGGGGFGNVYLAEPLRDRTQVAIKILEIRLTQPDDWRAFLNEARMFRLRHPHIMPLLDFGLSRQDEPFLVMDYAPGGTLRDRHPKGSRVPLPTVVDYATQVASALQYAHEQRLIHRDVKPENLLLRSDGVVLLSDFGIATAAQSTHSLTASAGVGGTVPYMAPEQLDGKPQSASDQYALAVVIYEWLTGRCPFVGTTVEVVVQHATKSPPSLLEWVPDLPLEVEEVLFHALAKNPRERFGTIQTFAYALRQASALPALNRPPPNVVVELSPLSEPPPSAGVESLPVSQPTLSAEAEPPLAGSITPMVPAFEMPYQPDLVQNDVNNRILSPQPNHRRRNLIVALVGGMLALLGGSGSVIAFSKIFCLSGQTNCNGFCTDLNADVHHCGSCGNVCSVDKICVNGVCQCLSGQTDCSGTCVNLKSDSSNCGNCGIVCLSGTTCVDGNCEQLLCPSGQTICSGICTTLQSNLNNCGKCGNVCVSEQTCVNGVCQCPSGQTICSGICTTLQSDLNNCGRCGNVCVSEQTCVNGTCCSACNGVCVDMNSDPNNCGRCGNVCGSEQTCVNGICQCPSGQTNCGGACVNTSSDSSNCGGCDHACPSYSICVSGRCQCTYTACGSICCPVGYSCVGGSCVALG